MKRIALILLYSSCYYAVFYGKSPDEPAKIEPLRIGNLALPSSQQPSPLFSFGQLILDKGDALGFTYFNGVRGCNRNFNEILPILAYGISDTFSIALLFPTALRFKEGEFCSSGIEDISLFLEYAYFDHPTETANNFASVLGGVFFPSGSPNKIPPLGTGAVNLFVGLTFVHLAIDWYYFTSHGALISNKKNGNKIGDQYLYQFGLGHNIKSPPGWIFLGLVEVDGIYTGRVIVDNAPVCNSETNIASIAPSLYVSNERLTLQAGMAFPFIQKLPVGINKTKYVFVVAVGWKFDGPALK